VSVRRRVSPVASRCGRVGSKSSAGPCCTAPVVCPDQFGRHCCEPAGVRTPGRGRGRPRPGRGRRQVSILCLRLSAVLSAVELRRPRGVAPHFEKGCGMPPPARGRGRGPAELYAGCVCHTARPGVGGAWPERGGIAPARRLGGARCFPPLQHLQHTREKRVVQSLLGLEQPSGASSSRRRVSARCHTASIPIAGGG
jgi:hypothetical protein